MSLFTVPHKIAATRTSFCHQDELHFELLICLDQRTLLSLKLLELKCFGSAMVCVYLKSNDVEFELTDEKKKLGKNLKENETQTSN